VKAIPLTQIEVPDFDLGLRGKLVTPSKVSDGKSAAFCTIVFGLDPAGGVVDTPLASAEDGYPDAFAVADESTRVSLSWRKSTEAVICDLVDDEGNALPESPRGALARLDAAYAELDLQPVLGFEYECYVMHADDQVLRDKNYSALRPYGRTIGAYDLSRAAESADLLGEYVDRMESVGIPVEAVHSELGPGFFEYALGPMPALRACDSAARSRQFFRDLCAERGLLATFMAKLHIAESGSGGHVHQSVTRNGVNLMADGQGGLSDIGRDYLGGLLSTMGDFTALFNPFLNSYKRLGAGFFVAESASWGWDNRNAACRVVHNAGDSATRIEHRRPGADANPYLVGAGMLAGGLAGLREHRNPGEALVPGKDPVAGGLPLPRSLREATERLRTSTVAREFLGDRLIDAYAITRDAESDAFDRWWATTITEWELHRLLENL